ncbi:MAG: DUF45 domain-containing protein [Kiritimatiellae bacterium]|nr:DUF45 domain-containing protein [Kiritimatiellia bacterium]
MAAAAGAQVAGRGGRERAQGKRGVMLHSGENVVGGVPVDVERKRIRRINIRVKADGRVHLSVPKWWATLKDGEQFLLSKWGWVVKTRAEVLARPVAARPPCTAEEAEALRALLAELNDAWAQRLCEPGVTWKIRRLKSAWGSCRFRRRSITYSLELARAPRAHVEYVVVHELTHLKAPNHGPAFYRLMDERLPGWKTLRRELNELGRA